MPVDEAQQSGSMIEITICAWALRKKQKGALAEAGQA